jgi:hypothetical protein
MRVEPILKILVPSMLLKLFPYIALYFYFLRGEVACVFTRLRVVRMRKAKPNASFLSSREVLAVSFSLVDHRYRCSPVRQLSLCLRDIANLLLEHSLLSIEDGPSHHISPPRFKSELTKIPGTCLVMQSPDSAFVVACQTLCHLSETR